MGVVRWITIGPAGLHKASYKCALVSHMEEVTVYQKLFGFCVVPKIVMRELVLTTTVHDFSVCAPFKMSI